MLTKIITPVLAMVATLMGAVAATPIAASADKRDEQAALKSGRITYYNPGTGACGQTHTDADFVVALSKYDFDPYTPDGNPNHNTLCGKYIRVSYNGKTVDVMVVDRCEGCNSGDIDLSPAAFQVLADLSVGVVQGSWDWI